MRGAAGDGGGKIPGHAHGADNQTVRVGDGCEVAEIRGGVCAFRRDAHEAAQGGAETGDLRADEGVSVGGGNAGFLRLVPDIDLDEQFREFAGGVSRFGDGVG